PSTNETATGSRPASEIADDGLGELRGLEQGGALRLPLEVVGDALLLDGAGEGTLDGGGGVAPAQPVEHHHAGEDQRAGVDLVLVRVLGRRAVGGLEHREAVALVAAR